MEPTRLDRIADSRRRLARGLTKLALRIRESTEEDFADLRKMLDDASSEDRRLLAFDFKKPEIMKAIRKGKHSYVADDDGEIVGWMRESGRPGGASHLEELYVPPHRRGNGVASFMMSSYHSRYPETTVKTKPDNEPMKNLLRRNGYRLLDPDAKQVLHWERG